MNPIAAQAQATLPMVPDRGSSSHPVVGVSASGVPLVNIVAPNRAGVSLNNFAHYNVGTQGAVIVNTPRSTQTQIAGWVPGNALMGNSPARLIINQVTTGNPTRLLGMTEIAGNRANLVIANPAGITCAGCGFINTPRVSITTGQPFFNKDGSLAGFDVVKGRLAVDGAGLDARGSAIDLIARALRVNGQVWADAIRATAGANEVSYGGGAPTMRSGEGEVPSVAIDVQALGGMYANSVRLVGTEAGVGVRSAGAIDSLTGDIELSANGEVTVEAAGRIQSTGSTRIEAPSVTNYGTISSGQAVRLGSGVTLRNDGVVAAQSNVHLAAVDISNAGQVFSGLDANGALTGPGSVSLIGKSVSSHGTLAAGDNINVSGSTVSLDGGTVFAASALNMNGDERLTTRGVVASALNATLKSKGAWVNDSGVFAATHGAHLEARSVLNRGGTAVGEHLRLIATDVENTGGILAGRRQAEISTANLSNENGYIGTDAGVLRVSTTGSLTNDRGQIIGGDGLSLDIHRLAGNRDGKIGIVSGNAEVRVALEANNDRGTILSGHRLKIIVDGGILNPQGSIVGGSGLELQAHSVDSNEKGEIGTFDGSMAIATHDGLNNTQGDVKSAGALTLNAHELENADGAVWANEASIQAVSVNNEGGRIGAAGTTDVRTERLRNQRGVIGSVEGVLTASVAEAIDNSRGKLLAGGDLELRSAGFVNIDGTVSGADVRLNAGDASIDNVGGVIAVNGRFDSESGAFDNRSGLIQAGASATIDAHSGIFDNGVLEGTTVGGRVISDGAILSAGNVHNVGGAILSSDATTVTGQSISNDQGAILSRGALGVKSAGPISNIAGQVGGDADVTMEGMAIDNTRGGIQAGETLTMMGDTIVNAQTKDAVLAPVQGVATLKAGIEGMALSLSGGVRIDNTDGSIRSDERANLIAPSMENARGVISSTGRLSVDARLVLTNVDGDLNAGRAMDLSTGPLINDGRIESDGNIELTVRGDMANRGRIRAGGDLDSTAQGNFFNSGSITSSGDAKVSGQRIDNAADGEIVGNIKTHLRASQSLSNEGVIDGGRAVVEVSDTLTNHGRIYGDAISIGAQTMLNDANAEGVAGAIASRGDVDIGANVVENRGGSLIYASNDIRTGASLDANGNASVAGSDRLTNSGSVIDAGSRVDIVADRFENLNAHFETAKITIDSGRRTWYTIPGSTEQIDPSTVYFYQRNSHEVKPGTEYQWALEDDQKFLLLPSTQYPFDEYAKYTINGVAGKIDIVHYGSLSSGSHRARPNQNGRETESVTLFRSVSPDLWAKFGIAPPPAPLDSSYIKSADVFVSALGHQRRFGADWYSLNVPIEQSRQAGSSPTETQSCLTSGTARCAPFKQWYDGLTGSYAALSRAINDYNADVRSRTVSTWTIYDINVKSTKEIVTATQPGVITAGSGMTISARSGINDKSQIVAGGRAYLNDAIKDNSQAKGIESFEGVGKAIHTWVGSGGAFRGDERKRTEQDYVASLPARQIDLPVAAAMPVYRDPVKRIAADAVVAIGVSDIPVPGAAARAIQSIGGTGSNGLGEVRNTVTALALTGAPGGLLAEKGSPTAIAQAKLGAVEIRTVEPNIKLPNNALYQIVANPGSRYLIEADPRFTNRRTWLSSEVMIAALSVDPSSVQRRLGDGFYEQQLVQQQIIQATGQRFIGNYKDNQTAYQSLMANGVKAAQRFGINVGTALTDAQMAALTDDIVWLVSRSVELPDGSEQTVLVPQVYLRANAADVTGTGSIIAGEDVVLSNKGTLANSGTITSRGITIITADSITNVGAVAGGAVRAQAQHDLTSLGGLILGNAIDLSAGRDINLVSTKQSATTVNGSATAIDRVSQINAGTLTVRAGRDLNAHAAQVVSSGDVSLAAQRDVNMSALRQSSSDHVQWGDKNRAEHSASVDIGTVIGSEGKVGIVAGRDLNATAAGVSAHGSVGVVAGRDIRLRAGRRSASAYDEHDVKESGILSTKSTHTIDASAYTDAIGTLLSGNSVEVVAGNNLTAEAATVAGTADVTLEAGQSLEIKTANTASREYHYRDVKSSGLGSAGAGISYGTNQAIDTSLDAEKGSRGSLIGSIGGSVLLRAGSKLHVTGSDVVASRDVIGIAKEIKVDASQTARHRHETHEVKSSGFTLAVKSPVTDALQNLNQQARGAGQSQDGRAAALHGIAAVGGVADLVGAAGGMTRALTEGGKPEAKLELSFGASRSKSTHTQDSVLRNGSHVKAGGKVAFVATGEKTVGQGNLTIEGSDVVASDALLMATNKMNLVHSTDTERSRNTNESQSASVGVLFGTNGWGVSAAMARGEGYANSDATMQNNTHIAASGTATIVSGGDTDIIGANVTAGKVIADVGGNLNVASVQDTMRSVAQQRSMGGGFSVSQGGGSASFSMLNGRASGNYSAVNEQSGIQAGEGGFDITVKGNTDLKAAYIASTAAPERNRLATGTLSFSDIRNGSGYDATSVGVSAGGGVGDGGNNYTTHGPTTGRNAGGSLPARVGESHRSEANTRSAISAGSIAITDEAKQNQDLATLVRDTKNLNGTVEKMPDLQSVLGEQSDLVGAAQASAETVAKQIGAYADSKREQALEAAKRETDPMLQERFSQEARNWGEGGGYRVALHIAGGAITGGLTGNGSGVLGGAAGAGLSAKVATQLKEIAQSIRDAGRTGNEDTVQLLGNVAANVLAGGLGAVAGGATGALTGAATDRFNRQLHQSEYDDAMRHSQILAKQLGIREREAEGRIVAEILRNSDKQTAGVSGGARDYEVRSIVGCKNLNCDGYKNDPQYANHDYNGEYIELNRASYDWGQDQLGSGMTDAELRRENLPYERLGKLAIAGGACLASGPVGCKAAVSGFAATLGLSYLSSSPLTTAETVGGIYGGALGGIYGQALRTWAGGTRSVMQSGVLFVTKTGTIAAGKQIGVPLGNSTGLAQSVDPLFDPATNPWWGLRNTWGRFKEPSN